MSFPFRGFKFKVADVVIFVAPLLAAFFLSLILALHNETRTAESSFNSERFIVMPRNCYLKIP